jgi:molybdopterin converting factor small subunit
LGNFGRPWAVRQSLWRCQKAPPVKMFCAGLRSSNRDLSELLFSEGVLRDHLHVFVNGENVNHREGLKTKLSDGDVLTFFTPISGG